MTFAPFYYGLHISTSSPSRIKVVQILRKWSDAHFVDPEYRLPEKLCKSVRSVWHMLPGLDCCIVSKLSLIAPPGSGIADTFLL